MDNSTLQNTMQRSQRSSMNSASSHSTPVGIQSLAQHQQSRFEEQVARFQALDNQIHGQVDSAPLEYPAPKHSPAYAQPPYHDSHGLDSMAGKPIPDAWVDYGLQMVSPAKKNPIRTMAIIAIALGICVALSFLTILSYGYYWSDGQFWSTERPMEKLSRLFHIGQPAEKTKVVAERVAPLASGEEAFLMLGAETKGTTTEAQKVDGQKLASAAATSSDLDDPAVEAGREDPFAPVLDQYQSMNGEKEEKDILENVRFTGFINDAKSAKKVAIIKIDDPVSGSKTLIKKMNETFTVEDKSVVLKNIKNNVLTVMADGQSRMLIMSDYSFDPVPGKGSASVTAAAPAGTATGAPSMAPAATGAASTATNANAGSGNGIVKLQEL